MGTSITIPDAVEERLSKRALTERHLSGTAQAAISNQNSSPPTQRQFKIHEDISFSHHNQRHFQQTASHPFSNQFENITLKEVNTIRKQETMFSKIEEEILKSLPINSISCRKDLQRLINGHISIYQDKKENDQNYSIFANLSDEAKEHFKKVSQRRKKTMKNKISCPQTLKNEEMILSNETNDDKIMKNNFVQSQEPLLFRQDKLFLDKKIEQNAKDKRGVTEGEAKKKDLVLIRIEDLGIESVKYLKESLANNQAKSKAKERNLDPRYSKSIKSHQICTRKAQIRF